MWEKPVLLSMGSKSIFHLGLVLGQCQIPKNVEVDVTLSVQKKKELKSLKPNLKALL